MNKRFIQGRNAPNQDLELLKSGFQENPYPIEPIERRHSFSLTNQDFVVNFAVRTQATFIKKTLKFTSKSSKLRLDSIEKRYFLQQNSKKNPKKNTFSLLKHRTTFPHESILGSILSLHPNELTLNEQTRNPNHCRRTYESPLLDKLIIFTCLRIPKTQNILLFSDSPEYASYPTPKDTASP